MSQLTATLLTRARCAGFSGGRSCTRTTQYLNNFMEQDHRGVKQRYYPMRGFGSFVSAAGSVGVR